MKLNEFHGLFEIFLNSIRICQQFALKVNEPFFKINFISILQLYLMIFTKI